MADLRSLETIQRWMQTVITCPDSIEAGIALPQAMSLIDLKPAEIDRIINPSHEMTSHDRLQIYGRAYFGRLLECLKSQFPAVCHSIGDEAFDGLAFGYLVTYPSTNYSLSSLGRSFEDYLTQTRPPRADVLDRKTPDFADFLIDLARLERIYGEVFDGPGPERIRSLEFADIAELTPTEFAQSRLLLHGCVRLLPFQFAVHEYSSAIRRGLDPDPLEARPILLVVTRRDYVVRRFELSKPQFNLLSALQNQSTIGEAINELCCETESEIGDLEHDLQLWFRDWTAAPLFSGISKPSKSAHDCA